MRKKNNSILIQESNCITKYIIASLISDVKEKEKSKEGFARNFTEGWIEFLSKRVAKEVACNLNSTRVGGKKRSRAHDVMWNIKYLSK